MTALWALRWALRVGAVVLGFAIWSLIASAHDHEPRGAVIRFDEAQAIYVRVDGEWIGWIAGAPDFVNGPFLDRYAADLAAPPTPTPTAAQPADLGWWAVAGEVATLTATDGGRGNAFMLRLSCDRDTRGVSVAFDMDRRGVPRALAPQPNPHRAYTERHGVPRIGGAGQILVTLTIDRETVNVEWWNLTPDYRWAFAPDSAVLDRLRDAHTLEVKALEVGQGWPARGEAPLRGIAPALDLVGCLP